MVGNELFILIALGRAGEAYGRALIDIIASLKHGRSVPTGSLYPSLERMKRKGLVRSRWGTEKEGTDGARRRYFALTAKGARVLREMREALAEP